MKPFTVKDFKDLVVKKQTHQVATRDGMPVRIIETRLRNNTAPVVGVLIDDAAKSDSLVRFSKDGTYCFGIPSLDIFLVPVDQKLTGELPRAYKINYTEPGKKRW
jgi:hypothetical protein